jgi:biofilm PGA synthesis N-glycosyltransferase PgaC
MPVRAVRKRRERINVQAGESRPLKYVLITPVRDEAAFIGLTLESIVAQTVLPLKWVIVSDGSTDRTDEIVKEYVGRHKWIELIRMPERTERHFGGKVLAFDAGYQQVKLLAYDVIGNLDGDTSFEPDYIEYLLGKFSQDPRLGVAGTNYLEDNSMKYDYRFTNIEDVTGQCQLFRRECFEQIGGYKPNKDGGVDLFATLAARMHGWQTLTFTDKYFIHHRPSGTAKVSKLLVEFHNGRKDYSFGCHPLWQPFRAAYRLTRKPFVIGGCLLFAGYYWAVLTGRPKSVSDDLVRFRRKEQINRLRNLFRRVLGSERAPQT